MGSDGVVLVVIVIRELVVGALLAALASDGLAGSVVIGTVELVLVPAEAEPRCDCGTGPGARRGGPVRVLPGCTGAVMDIGDVATGFFECASVAGPFIISM